MKKEVKFQDLQLSPTIAKQALIEALVPSFYENVMNDFQRKVIDERDFHLQVYLRENLKQFGYEFGDKNEFLEFCGTRVCAVSFEDKPNYFEFFIDYVNEENRGKLIGACSYNVEFVNEFNKITAIVG